MNGLAQQIRQMPLTAQQRIELERAHELFNKANASFRQGKTPDAIEFAKSSLEIRERILGKEHPKTIPSLDLLGTLFTDLEDLDRAGNYYKRALETNEDVYGPDSAEVASTLNNLSGWYRRQGKYETAELMGERSYNINKKTHGPADFITQNSHLNLAKAYEDHGKFAAAEKIYLHALELEQLGTGRFPVTSLLDALGSLNAAQGNYETAERMYRRALEIRRTETELDGRFSVAGTGSWRQSWQHLAELFFLRKQYSKATKYYQGLFDDAETASFSRVRADGIFVLQYGDFHAKKIGPLNRLSEIHTILGNLESAATYCRRSLELCESEVGSEHSLTAKSLWRLANVYSTQQNHKAAEPLYRRAIAIFAKQLGQGHPDTASCSESLASMYVSQEKYAEAETLYRTALQTFSNSLGEYHPSTVQSLTHLASLQAARRDFHEATDLMDRARHATHRYATRLLPSLTEKDRTFFMAEKYQSSFHTALSLALSEKENQDLVTRSASWVTNGKAVVQESAAQRGAFSNQSEDSEVKSLVKELQQVRDQLARVAMSAVKPEHLNTRRERLKKLTSEEQLLYQQITAAGVSSDADVADWIEMSQVRAAIPNNAALVDIARFEFYDFSPNGSRNHWQPARYSAWITYDAGGNESILVDLGEANDIDELVESVRSTIQESARRIQSDGEGVASAKTSKAMRVLADRIWKPLESHLREVDNVVLSPDGALWLVPWHALNTDDDGQEFLLEKYSLRLVVSARDLVAQSRQFATNQPVIFANPRFDQQANEKRSAIQAVFKKQQPADDATERAFLAKSVIPRVSPLPNTGLEAKSIQPQLDKLTGRKSVLYEKRYALERVAKALVRPQIASFATHGFFLPKQETKPGNRNLLENSETRSVALDMTAMPIENPLLRCGLLLAGSNNRGAVVGDDDGILTGLEISGLNLHGTEMVVLSACETGVGDINNGEGVAGLRQAFQLAGAQSVVATLWSVPDRDSALMMSDFFSNLAKGQSRCEALRQAQLNRIKSRRERHGAAHPFFWAAWTLTGQD